MIFRPRRIKTKLVKGLPKLMINVELIRVDPDALSEIKSASPGEMAKTSKSMFKEEVSDWSVLDVFQGSLLKMQIPESHL